MLGLLTWMEPQKGKRQKKITIQETAILHMRCQQAEVLRGPHTSRSVLRRRITEALKRMKKSGVTRVILPEEYRGNLPDGVIEVSTLPLRKAMAANWVQYALAQKGVAGTRVGVSSQTLTGEVVRTVTELALRYRYVSICLPYGGEELTQRLRREYGVSLLLNPEPAQMEEVEALVLFDERTDLSGRNPVVIPIYDETVSMPPMLLPTAMEERLPPDVNRTQLFAALMQAGVIRPGTDLTF